LNPTAAILVLIGWFAISGALIITAPGLLSDQNGFLKNFVTHKLLGFLGVVVTITLASVANLFVNLLRIEDERDRSPFPKTKRDLRDTSIWLLVTLGAALPLVWIKAMCPPWPRLEATFNAAALGLVIFSILLLIDGTLALFALDKRS
jgi:hypothetical protein